MCMALSLLIYLPCYYGNGITAKSDSLSTCIYKSNWMGMDRSNKKIMIILMQRFNRSTLVTVGWVFLLNLQTFTSVVEANYFIVDFRVKNMYL